MSGFDQGNDGFKAPGNPAIPQDLALIMQMVAEQGGSTEATGSVSEARAALEQSGAKPVEPAPEVGSDSDSDSDSDDSSSEGGSSDDADAMVEADSDAEADVAASAPMSAGTHAHLLSQLTSFVEGTSQHVNAADSDDEDFVLSDPLATEHEVPLPTVVAPPIERVPDSEKRVLAGAVMSWMPAKGVIEWMNAQEAEEAEAREAEEVIAEVAGGVDSEEANMSADTSLDAQLDKQESSTTEVAVSQATLAVLDVSTVSPSKVDKGKGKATSKFTSSGTVVIRAIHNPQASAGDGWLEEGSLLCWEDGRVLGTVSETFGPLTSPFYQVRVAPPPFPFPSAESLAPGTKLFYPHTSQYRSFVPVRMLQTDPRLKGSDASNRYDEEVGEDEMEWSDDELEAAAKRGKKNRKGKGNRQGSAAPSTSTFQHPLPPRPHFDHEAGDDEPLYYDEADAGSEWNGSEAGSAVGGRTKPEPYDVEDRSGPDAVPRRGHEDRRGRGRGGKPARGRGGGRPQQMDRKPQSLPPRPASPTSANFGQGQGQFPGQGMQQPFQPQFHQQPQQFIPQNFPFQQPMPGYGFYPNPQQQQFMMMMQQQQQQQYGYQPQGYGYMPQQTQQSPHVPQPQQQQQQQQPVAPAINPRFAAQYQHMMGGPAPPGGGSQDGQGGGQ